MWRRRARGSRRGAEYPLLTLRARDPSLRPRWERGEPASSGGTADPIGPGGKVDAGTSDAANWLTIDEASTYQLIADLTTDYVYSLVPTDDGGFDLDWVSEGFERVTRYTLDEIRESGGWTILIHPSGFETASAALAKLGQGYAVRDELQVICKNGHTIWVRGFMKPLLDERGELVRIVGAAQDITAEKEALLRLTKSQEVLARSERLAHVGSWKWEVLTDRQEWSDELFRIFGLEPESFDPSFEGFIQHVHPEDRDFVRRMTETSFAERRFSFYYRIIRASDGLERIVHVQGEVESDTDGSPLRVYGSNRDVTEYMRGQYDLVQEVTRSRLVATTARIANEATTIQTALSLCLGAICDVTGWDAGHAFLVQGAELVATDIWHDAAASDLTPLKQATARLAAAGQPALPGRVLSSARAISLTDEHDDPAFVRRGAATECGLRSIHLFPMLSLDQPVGVIEFFSHERCELEPHMKDLMMTIGVQLGRAVERHRAAVALSESEERFRSLAQTARDAILSVDGAGVIHYANPAVESVFGYSVDELEGSSVTTLMPERFRDRYREGIAPVLEALDAGKGADLIELTGRRKDGIAVPVELSLSRRKVGDGHIYTAILRDISERMRIERELAYKEAQLEEAQFIALMGSWELRPQTGELLYSKGLLNMLGFPLDARITFADLQKLVHPGDLQRLGEMTQEIARSGGGRFDHSFRITRPDGSTRTIQTQGMIEASTQGDVERIVAVDRDVTEQQLAARLPIHQAQVLQMIAQRAPLDRVLDTIARKIEDESEDALCTILLVDEAGDKLHYGTAPSLSSTFRNKTDGISIADGAGCCGTAAYLRQPVWSEDLDRDPRWADCREAAAAERLRSSWSVPVFSSNGNQVIGTFALYRRTAGEFSARDQDLLRFFTDLVAIAIERKKADDTAHALELQYRQAQKMEAVGRLAGGVAHDFNNLLQAVLGSAGFLVDSFAASDPRREDAEVIVSAAKRGSNLVRQLLTFARRHDLVPEPIDVNVCVTQLQPLLKATVGEAIELEFDLDPRPVHTVMDPSSLEQIVLNLVRNAVEATAPDGRIWISTAATSERFERGDADHVALVVGDNGCGIDPAVVPRIFEPFFTTRPVGEGSGLGLASAFGSVEAAGGAIYVDTAPGEGTTFSILLPVGPPPPEVRSEEDVTPAQGGGATILLAEDEPVVATVLQKALERKGYSVVAADNGTEALEHAMSDAVAIDIVVTDVVMPGLSGPEVVRRLRASGRSVRALYMSGYSEDTLDRRRLEPDDGYIAKPFTADDLVAAVEEVLTPKG